MPFAAPVARGSLIRLANLRTLEREARKKTEPATAHANVPVDEHPHPSPSLCKSTPNDTPPPHRSTSSPLANRGRSLGSEKRNKTTTTTTTTTNQQTTDGMQMGRMQMDP